MIADPKTTEAEEDPVAIALNDGNVRERLFKAARAALSRRVHSISAIQIREEANEIVSKAINEILRRRHTYQPERDIVAWMGGFIVNAVRDFSRQHARVPTGPPPDAIQLADLARDLGRPIEEVAENKEFVEWLYTQLTRDERCLIEMKYVEDLTFAEIAERLEMNVTATRVRHYRIIARLRQLAGKSGEVQS